MLCFQNTNLIFGLINACLNIDKAKSCYCVSFSFTMQMKCVSIIDGAK